MQEIHHGPGDRRAFNEVNLLLEDVFGVGIKPEDESACNPQPAPVQNLDGLNGIQPQVLVLFGFGQALFHRTLNPNKHIEETRLHHGLNQRRTLGEVHRSFGVERQRETVSLLPLFQFDGQLQSELVIADEIIIDNKHLLFPSQAQESVQFRQQLLGALHSRLSSVKDDDVTELTLKRTATGELNRHGGVIVIFQKVESCYRRLGDVGLLCDFIKPFRRPVFQVSSDLMKHFVRLARHDMIRQLQQYFRFAARVGSAHDRAPAQAAGAGKDLLKSFSLHAHAADHDEIRPEDVVITYVFHLLVNQANGPFLGTQGGYRDEAQRRHEDLFVEDPHHAREAPKRAWEFGPYHECFDSFAERAENRNSLGVRERFEVHEWPLLSFAKLGIPNRRRWVRCCPHRLLGPDYRDNRKVWLASSRRAFHTSCSREEDVMDRSMNFPLGDSEKLGWELRGVNRGAGAISPVPSLDASHGL